MEITRKLKKESLIYFYTIYTTIISSYTKLHISSMSLPYYYHKVNMLQLYIIVLISFTMF